MNLSTRGHKKSPLAFFAGADLQRTYEINTPKKVASFRKWLVNILLKAIDWGLVGRSSRTLPLNRILYSLSSESKRLASLPNPQTIETGRLQSTPEEDWLCEPCGLNDVQSESHFYPPRSPFWWLRRVSLQQEHTEKSGEKNEIFRWPNEKRIR